MDGVELALAASAAAGVLGSSAWGLRRARYVLGIRGRGWTLDSDPDLSAVFDLTVPPLGLGFERSVDDLITGTTSSGRPFRVFRYRSGDGGPSFGGRVAAVALARPLAELTVTDDKPRAGRRPPAITLPSQVSGVGPAWQVSVDDGEYARAALTGKVTGALRSVRMAGGRLEVSVDGDNLVSVRPPRGGDLLARHLEALAAAADGLEAADLSAWTVAPPPPRFSFYRRPGWVLVGSENRLIDTYELTREGHHHTTEKLVRGSVQGLTLEAFVHRWQTTKTIRYRDSKGRRRTREVTEYHDETVTGVRLPFTVPLLAVNAPSSRMVDRATRVEFESTEFNREFSVRCRSPKFAYDVLHPRTMERLLAMKPLPFVVRGSVMRFFPPRHDTLLIGHCADVATALWSGVPSFVWSDLGVPPPMPPATGFGEAA